MMIHVKRLVVGIVFVAAIIGGVYFFTIPAIYNVAKWVVAAALSTVVLYILGMMVMWAIVGVKESRESTPKENNERYYP